MTELRFKRTSVRNQVDKHFPACPPVHREAIILAVVERTWTDVTIGKAVGIVMTNYIRHKLTDYDVLMRQHRLTREEARTVEAATVRDIWRSWKRPFVQVELRITPLSTTRADDEGSDEQDR